MKKVIIMSDATGREADVGEIFAHVIITMDNHMIKNSDGNFTNRLELDVEPAHLNKVMGSAEFVENVGTATKFASREVNGRRLP